MARGSRRHRYVPELARVHCAFVFYSNVRSATPAAQLRQLIDEGKLATAPGAWMPSQPGLSNRRASRPFTTGFGATAIRLGAPDVDLTQTGCAHTLVRCRKARCRLSRTQIPAMAGQQHPSYCR